MLHKYRPLILLATSSCALSSCVILPAGSTEQPVPIQIELGIPDTTPVIVHTPAPRSSKPIHSAHAIVHQTHGLCLDISRQVTNGAPLQLWPCNGRINQQFIFTPTGEIRVDGLCLDVAQNHSANNTPVIAYTCHGGKNQHWYRQGNTIRSALNGKCLNAVGKLSEAGAKVKIWDCNGNQHQQFQW